MESLRKNYNRIISLKQAKRLIIVLFVVFFFDFLLFPVPALANQLDENFLIESNISENQAVITEYNQIISQDDFNILEVSQNINFLPENKDLAVERSRLTVITAYNSEVGQCDSSPCITANGFDVCQHGIEDTIAANFLPFGAKVRIPEIFGSKVFIVRDRMNPRFSHRIDVWMIDKTQAKQFGVKIAKIEVLE